MTRGSYGRYAVLLVPAWLVAGVVLVDQARRLGGVFAAVAAIAAAVVVGALLAFAWMRRGG